MKGKLSWWLAVLLPLLRFEDDGTALASDVSSIPAASNYAMETDQILSEKHPVAKLQSQKSDKKSGFAAVADRTAPTCQSPASSESSTQSQSSQEHCSIYLAPSSIPDQGTGLPVGFGIYTTRPLQKGEYIWRHGEGPSVVVPDVAINYQQLVRTTTDLPEETIKKLLAPEWAQYIFLYPCVGFNTETNDPQTQKDSSLESNMNLGALANFHPWLKNVVYDDTDLYHDGLLDRYRDPGAGAFSYHRGKYWYATKAIAAGEEIFLDYGESWFLDTTLGEAGQHIPRELDYFDASKALLDWMEDGIMEGQQGLLEFLMDVKERYNGRVASLIPGDFSELSRLLQRATTYGDDVKSDDALATEMAKATILGDQTNVEWIKKNGDCLEKIVPRKSTIRQAGMGAFAQWSIEKGERIVPVPTLLQVVNKTTFNIYEQERVADGYLAKGVEPITQQLLLNYCLGNPKSSMVVCPSTNANLINHCGPLVNGEGACRDGEPNAKIQWGTNFDPMTQEWLRMSMDDIQKQVKNKRRGISLEVVALRHIEAGEEIFIDYGRSWEEAWLKYVQTWTPPKDRGFVPVSKMNQNVTAWIRTERELKTNPYPFEVRLGCFVSGFYHPCTVLKKLKATEADLPLDIYDHTQELPGQRKPNRRMLYKVRLEEMTRDGTWEFRYKWRFPQSSVEGYLNAKYIRFFPGLYNSDQHLPGTFRHSIDAVPDDEWPEQWKDLQ